MLNYRIKKVTDSDGYSEYTVQRKMLGIWWGVYVEDLYGTPRILEILFGSPKHFREFEQAREWIMRRLNKEDVEYYYHPFEANND